MVLPSFFVQDKNNHLPAKPAVYFGVMLQTENQCALSPMAAGPVQRPLLYNRQIKPGVPYMIVYLFAAGSVPAYSHYKTECMHAYPVALIRIKATFSTIPAFPATRFAAKDIDTNV